VNLSGLGCAALGVHSLPLAITSWNAPNDHFSENVILSPARLWPRRQRPWDKRGEGSAFVVCQRSPSIPQQFQEGFGSEIGKREVLKELHNARLWVGARNNRCDSDGIGRTNLQRWRNKDDLRGHGEHAGRCEPGGQQDRAASSRGEIFVMEFVSSENLQKDAPNIAAK
jgi:hypothetical protein